ncbi:hypothetical protein G4Y79_14605 [Phototrophicus methaneseepsis]|uniref:Uncharacterized protein n=1 Tax=Phototrophicus methaneseepsis TaxID=2710758 RepID=A0A7S8ICW3_9CHLR|nr:hypothetical protein [Phototrophicus methaneseepsis]QPC80937.1 hypothetical protein G4Y79_14605 [Phototrophicus methaneseepsis]
MDDLSSRIINSKWVREMDEHLRLDLENVELIGELDITQEAFQYICIALREQCRFKNNIQPKYLYPALFVASMVFSARYSQDETRKFWEPYAEDVWGINYSKHHNRFYNACRDYFIEAKAELSEKLGFEFQGQSEGDVVRTVYWHTILPSYLHDDFARWLSPRIQKISELPENYLSEFVRSQQETRYVAPTLQAFLSEDDTHEIALDLIRDLVAAVELLANHVDILEIRQLFPSLIHRELWDKLVAELQKESLVARPTERSTKIEWVWSFELEDWVLRVVNLVTDTEKQPTFCVLSKFDAEDPIWDHIYREDLWAEKQPNRKWRIREIVLGTLDDVEMLDAIVYVFNQSGDCIWTEKVPRVPQQDYQFYRITQQGKYAIPESINQITNGRWLVSHVGDFSIHNDLGQQIEPTRSDYYISSAMQDMVGHTIMAMYDLKLPLEIRTAKDNQKFEKTKRRYISQPKLFGKDLVIGTSDRLPPVYSTNKVKVHFSEITFATKYLKIHVTTPTEQIYRDFSEYARPNGTGYDIDLSQIIPEDQIGTYEVDITYGFRSRLASPIEVTIIPDLAFSIMPNTIFNPLNPPTIDIHNLTTENLELGVGQGIIEYKHDNSAKVTWCDLKSTFCRLLVCEGNGSVFIEWRVDRFYAWIENSTFPNRLTQEDLNHTKIQFRGTPNSKLALFVDESYFGADLNAKGEAVYDLFVDQFRDILQQTSKTSVPLRIRFDDEFWTFAVFTKAPQIMKAQIDYVLEDDQEWILFDFQLSNDWDKQFEVEVRSADQQRCVKRSKVEDTHSVLLIPANLQPGQYELCLFADGEVVESSSKLTFDVPKPEVQKFEIDYDRQKSTLKVDYSIDRIRVGSYKIQISDENGTTITSKSIVTDDINFATRLELAPEATYRFTMFWNNQPISLTKTFIVENNALDDLFNNAESLSQSTQTTRLISETTNSDQNNWIQQLIDRTSSAPLASSELLKLSNISYQELQAFTTNQLAKLWRPLARLSEVHKVTEWTAKYGPLPSWALLDNVLGMVTKEGKSYLVYPELVLEGGLTGIGKIALETPQEGKIYGYARWSKRTDSSSRLHVWIPTEEPDKEPFTKLDELDMWPAYYDRLSGKFHGSRHKPMMPGLNKLDRTYLVDVAHSYTLIVSVCSTHLQLFHAYWSRASIDRFFTQAILQKRIESVETLSINRSLITKPSGYRYATVEWCNNYLDDRVSKHIIKNFVSDNDLGGKLSKFLDTLPRLAQIANMPLLFGAIRFIAGMEKQVSTDSEQQLMRLDKNILSLGIILRIRSMDSNSITKRLIDDTGIPESELAQAVHDANKACPTLFEWALTWAEVLSIHSANQ